MDWDGGFSMMELFYSGTTNVPDTFNYPGCGVLNLSVSY